MSSKAQRFIFGRLKMIYAWCELIKYKKSLCNLEADRFKKSSWEESLSNPTEFYKDCVGFFYSGLPQSFKKHRFYFSKKGRGFGEDAFHVMWWIIFKELRPENFLEIGVYRGQTLSLASLLQKHFSIQGSVTGISPFQSVGDTVSTYRGDVDYLNDTVVNFKKFDLPTPTLVKAYSTDKEALAKISSQSWDAIYIDGNHDYLVAKRDWEVCSENLKIGGVVILDDSALTTNFSPPSFATGGHPGPSKLAQEIDASKFTEILQVGHNRVYQRTK